MRPFVLLVEVGQDCVQTGIVVLREQHLPLDLAAGCRVVGLVELEPWLHLEAGELLDGELELRPGLFELVQLNPDVHFWQISI